MTAAHRLGPSNRPRLIVVGPLPPPFHGVSVSTSLVIANEVLRARFGVEHLNTSDHRPRNTIGRWEARNVQLALAHTRRLSRRLTGDRGVVYLPLSQGMAGFLRDAIFIRLAARRGWKVAAHLRGGEFRQFYEKLSPPARGLVRSTLLRVDSMAVLGDGLRSMFSGLIPDERIRVVPNGTPDPWPGGVPQRGEGAVLFLSNLRRRKGLLEAVETARLVLARKPEARFVFAGEWDDAALAQTICDVTRNMGIV